MQPDEQPGTIHTDTSLESVCSREDLCWNHDESTPYRSDTNEIAERSVRRVEEGTSALLVQAGISEKWWREAVECFCYLRNNSVADGKSPDERRCGTSFCGPLIPFGARNVCSSDLCERHISSGQES